MNIQVDYKLNLIEARSLSEYKGQPITSIEWDATYGVFFWMTNESENIVIEHRLESDTYHPDLDEVMESEALEAIEAGLSNFLVKLSADGVLRVFDGMTLYVEFTDNKNGVPTYRIITETIVG